MLSLAARDKKNSKDWMGSRSETTLGYHCICVQQRVQVSAVGMRADPGAFTAFRF